MTINEAKTLARQHKCFIVTWPNCFFLYREAQPRNVCVGKRTHEKDIIALVKKTCKAKTPAV